MTPDLSQRLLADLQASRLFASGGRALLAVSGGTDSLAMLRLFADIRTELDLELLVAHVDHGITPQSAQIAEAVVALARQSEIPVRVGRLELGAETSETEAREARYRVLRSIQDSVAAAYLVTAHHADDQAETILYRILRGSGPAGLAGIPDCGPQGLVRPLLRYRKAALAEWLESESEGFPPGLPHADPANSDPGHDRSWTRTVLLPLLRTRFGEDVDTRLLTTADHAKDDRAAWRHVLQTLPDLGYRASGSRAELARGTLARYDKTLCEALLRAVGREIGCMIGHRAARRLQQFATRQLSGRKLELGGGWIAVTVFDRLVLERAGERPSPGDVTVAPWGVAEWGTLEWCGWELTWRLGVAEPMTRQSLTTWVTPGSGDVRIARRGERLWPMGGTGRRKIRRLLMESRVAREERQAYPVVSRHGEALWVPGVCRSSHAVPRPGQMAMRLDARRIGGV